MYALVVLVALVGTTLSAPQVAYKSPYSYGAYPYSTPYSGYPAAFAPAYPRHAAFAPAYAKPAVYSGAFAPAYAKPAVYSAAFAPAYAKPAAYAPGYVKPSVYSAAPVYPYAPQPHYPSQYVKPVAIVRQSQDDNFDGSFSYDFQAENGIASQASGFVKNAGTEAEAQVIQGTYSYTSPDGTPIVTRWFADDSGFHAEGDHIPKPPADPYRTA